MGGTTFDVMVEGTDVADCYNRAVEQAAFEHGHGGYTGTIAEKSGYVVIDHTVRTPDDAFAYMQTLLSDYNGASKINEVVNDKWGPAAAIPVAAGTHSGVQHEREVKVKTNGQPSYEDLQVQFKAAVGTLRLKADERVLSWAEVGQPAVLKETVKAVADKAKTKTRHVVIGSDRANWSTGFDSQSDARAYAVEFAKTPQRSFATIGGFATIGDQVLEVVSVTRRENGEPLVKVTRVVGEVEHTLKVVVVKGGPKQTDLRANAWLFFGWASC